jgi:GxxExxY protein
MLADANFNALTSQIISAAIDGYRVDLIVEDTVVVEIKSVERLLPVHQAQVLTYVGLTGCPAGLLINFNVPKLIDGVKRVINPRHPSNSVPPTDSVPT